jgi:hypothetical protein
MRTITISRRAFVTSLAFAPAVAYGSPHREFREQFQLDHRVPVLMILSAHATSKSAEQWRRHYAMEPFDGMGEWYLESTISLDLPESLADLPGSLAQFNYIAGVAAAKSSMLVGAFRRDNIACVYRVHGESHHVIALAEDFASRRIPELPELLWKPDRLQAFVPTTDRLGMDVSPSEAFWP